MTLTRSIRLAAAHSANVGKKITYVVFHEQADRLVRGTTSASNLILDIIIMTDSLLFVRVLRQTDELFDINLRHSLSGNVPTVPDKQPGDATFY